jgi:mono/diheme cytochrome c family protein
MYAKLFGRAQVGAWGALIALSALLPLVSTCARPTPVPTPTPTQQSPAALYARFCSACHGDNGEGVPEARGPALNNQDLLTIADDAFLIANTARGRPGSTMSAWSEEYGGPIPVEDIARIVSHIRSWQTEASIDVSDYVARGDAQRGAELFDVHCANCHRTDAAGGSGPSLVNPVFLETASDGFIRESILRGRRDTEMPGFADELAEQDVGDIISFLRRR